MENIQLIAASKNDKISSKHVFLSFLIKIPTVYLAQLNTHRVLSKSSISARAVPIPKYIDKIIETPYIPQFGKAQSGMKSGIIEDSFVENKAKKTWDKATQFNIEVAKYLDNLDIHKEHANRILAPFAYSTVIVSGTEWDNFLDLRCPKYKMEGKVYRSKRELINDFPSYSIEDKDLFKTINISTAQPEFQEIAEVMYDIYKAAIEDINSVTNKYDLETLYNNTWTMAFESILKERQGFTLQDSLACSSSKCARISFGNFKQEEITKHKSRAEKLVKDKHMGVFEHQVRNMTEYEYFNFSKSFIVSKEDYESRAAKSEELYGSIGNDYSWDLVQKDKHNYLIKEFGWCNNLRGFISYRYILDSNITI